MQQPDMSLPALEQMEEATNSLAGMCARFYKQLVENGLPDAAATELACVFAENLFGKAFNPDA